MTETSFAKISCFYLRVDKVDHLVLPWEGNSRRGNRDSSLALLRKKVHHGVSSIDSSNTLDLPSEEKHLL